MRADPPSDPNAEQPVDFADDGGCFGCSAANPAGLQLRFRRRGETILADCRVADRFHGAPGIAHGGIVAALLDEVSCAAAHFTGGGTLVVTGELSVRYHRPCPVEVPLTLTARIVDASHRRYLVIEAEVGRDGDVLARSTGKFFYNDGGRTTPVTPPTDHRCGGRPAARATRSAARADRCVRRSASYG